MLFLKFLCEELGVAPGNYVSLQCDDLLLPDELLPKSGTKPTGKSHVTLMYSPESAVDSRILDNQLSMVPQDMELVVTGFSVFDSLDKDNPEALLTKGCIVANVQHPFLQTIHDSLETLGMEHTYPEFSPHITIAYDVDIDEARLKCSGLNMWLENQLEPLIVQSNSITHEPVDKEWVSKL